MSDTNISPKRIPDQQSAMSRLRDGEVRLPPLEFKVVEAPGWPESQSRSGRARDQYDALLDVSWKGKRYRFAVEYKLRSTPKVFEEAVVRIGGGRRSERVYPLLMVPYFSTAQLAELEKREISGLDLCGNGIVIVPGELCVLRSGQPNSYPQSEPIKNIYRGASSLVPRVFLACPRFETLGDIKSEIGARNGRVAISTISKAVATLEQDLIVSKMANTRGQSGVRLIQAEALLDQLSRNYKPPRVQRQVSGESSISLPALATVLADRADGEGFRCAMTGLGSIGQYATMAREPKLQVYCTNLTQALDALASRFRETARFADVELIETLDEFAFFDPRPVGGIPWASPVQVFLELMSGDKRDQETAGQVRGRILQEVGV